MDDLTKKFESFESLMTQALDKLLAHSECMESRLLRLESAPPSAAPPRSQKAPPQPPSRWVNPFDLNMAPQLAARPSASASERPSGHGNVNGHRDDGGGILGAHPPRPVTGMPLDPPLSHDSDSEGIGVLFVRIMFPSSNSPCSMAQILVSGSIVARCSSSCIRSPSPSKLVSRL